jgi:hypothetical protein
VSSDPDQVRCWPGIQDFFRSSHQPVADGDTDGRTDEEHQISIATAPDNDMKDDRPSRNRAERHSTETGEEKARPDQVDVADYRGNDDLCHPVDPEPDEPSAQNQGDRRAELPFYNNNTF